MFKSFRICVFVKYILSEYPKKYVRWESESVNALAELTVAIIKMAERWMAGLL